MEAKHSLPGDRPQNRFSLGVTNSRPLMGYERSRGGGSQVDDDIMTQDLYYSLKKNRLGSSFIINNLHTEQSPTQRDVDAMSAVLKEIGFDVNIYRDLNSQAMNEVKKKMTMESSHQDANCFLLLIISHGTADNFLLDKDGAKTWNLEALVTEICDIQALVGKPKLFFIEACRGQEHNRGMQVMTKSTAPPPPTAGITLPNKQDVFVGFATVPGYVALTASSGSPYLQALATELGSRHASMDLADIHLHVKRKLAARKMGAGRESQGAEERSSLLSKLLFSRYSGTHKGTVKEGGKSVGSFSLFSSSSQPLTSRPISSITTTPASGQARPVSSILPTSSQVLPRQATASGQERPVSSILPASNQPSQLGRTSLVGNIASTASPPLGSASARALSSQPPRTAATASLASRQLISNASPRRGTATSASLVSLPPRPAQSASISLITPGSLVAHTSHPGYSFLSMTSSEKPHLATSSTNSLRSSFFASSPSSTSSHPSSITTSARAFANSTTEANRLSKILELTTLGAERTKKTSVHSVEITSGSTEAGLKNLLKKVIELYGGEGKVKAKKKNKVEEFSFKYKGPERMGKYLDDVASKVNEMQKRGVEWKLTQTLEITTIEK